MKNAALSLILVFLAGVIFSCKESEQCEMKSRDKSVHFLDSLPLEDSVLPVGSVVNCYLSRKNIVLPDLTNKCVRVFDRKGVVVSIINGKKARKKILPSRNPDAIYAEDTVLHFLYANEKVVFQMSPEGQLIRKIYLKINALEAEIETNSSVFAYVRELKRYVLTVNQNFSYAPNLYDESKALAAIDEEGEFLFYFSDFPNYFGKGYFIASSYLAGCFDRNNLYSLFAFDKDIKEYNLSNGKCAKNYQVLEKSNEKNIHFKNEPILSLQDTKISEGFLGCLKQSDREVFYFWKDDVESNKTEIEMRDFNECIGGTVKISSGYIPQFIQGDTLFIIQRKGEDLLLKSFQIR